MRSSAARRSHLKAASNSATTPIMTPSTVQVGASPQLEWWNIGKMDLGLGLSPSCDLNQLAKYFKQNDINSSKYTASSA
jgi:hypothetical protein